MNMPSLAALRFDNRFVRELPADPETDNFRRQISAALYSNVAPTPVRAPQLVAYAQEVAALLGLTPADCETPGFAEVFAGNRLLEGMRPHATCYGGHQFGNWAGQLGDGRAINLGEVVNDAGQHWTLQLKGAGPTPYSRTADGLAVLRSSVREFLCSEAMFHLGVPTTRALSLCTTGESVVRDVLYDGHPAAEPGAVVCRVAPSFTRFGHFEMLAARGEVDLLRRLADFTIDADFGDLDLPASGPDRYVGLFAEVCERTARMIVEWMRVGFVHGVMNTDNMSILGLTIDYGPYGWLEDFDPDWTPNTTDAAQRRYRYGQQPAIAQWNLLQLANALYPLIDDANPLERELGVFARRYGELDRDMRAAKLGLVGAAAASAFEPLCQQLDAQLRAAETDMTIFHRRLIDVDAGMSAQAALEALAPAFYLPEQVSGEVRDGWLAWLTAYQAALRAANVTVETRRAAMRRANPKYVLRNYMAQLAIDAAEQGDASVVNELLELLRRPYDEQPEQERWAARRPDWARERVGCSMLSCSS